jgi:hypothetical protein
MIAELQASFLFIQATEPPFTAIDEPG